MSQESPPPFNGEQLVRAARYFFDWYVRAERVPRDDVARLNPGHFIKWLRDHDFAANNPYAQGVNAGGLEGLIDGVGRELRVPDEAVAFVLRLGESSTGLAHLSGLWPYLVLDGRPTEHAIRSVQLMLIVQWADDTVCPLTRLSHAESNPTPIRDAEVVHFISSQGSQFAAQVLSQGCDALHDQNQSFKGLASPDTLAKVMLSAQDALRAGRIGQHDMAAIDQLVRFVGSMFPRTLPERTRKEFEAARDRGPDEPTPPPPPPPPAPASGGWDA